MSEDKIAFMHRLFAAAANLYGIVMLQDQWDVCREPANRQLILGIHKKELVLFFDIVRRESVPYYVYEIDEGYSVEERKPIEQIMKKKVLNLFCRRTD